MTLTLLLPWFPILLTVGLGGRLLGRSRGFALGLLGALFWVALLQASTGAVVWANAWNVATILTGSVAIVAIGGWAGESGIVPQDARFTSNGMRRDVPLFANSGDESGTQDTQTALDHLTAAFDEFDDWLADHREDNNPWPKFDELIRAILYRCCKATHVKPLRVVDDGQHLIPLREADPFVDVKPLSARVGVIGEVLATGRSFLDAAKVGSPLKENTAWCFAVHRSSERLGVIVVGQLGVAPEMHRSQLAAVERLIAQFWCTLQEACNARTAVLDDPVSGLYTREAFVQLAEQSLSDSYRQGEPVAVAVLALEGLREVNDAGRWEVADELVHAVGRALRQKARSDDRVGRFDGSRFLLLLRRVDAELANLIVAQIVARLRAVCGEPAQWGAAVSIRCGLAGSGNQRPDLRSLVSRSLAQWQRARKEGVAIASEFPDGQLPIADCQLAIGNRQLAIP